MSYGHGPYSSLPYSALPVAGGPATQFVDPIGIASAEAFGVAILDQAIYPTGIASLEAFGAATVNMALDVSGIASAEIFGVAAIDLIITVAGIASTEAFGDATIIATQFIDPLAIGSAEVFGVAQVGEPVPEVGGGNVKGHPRVRRRKLQRLVRRDGTYAPEIEEVAEGQRKPEQGTPDARVGSTESPSAPASIPRPPLESVVIAHHEPQEREQALVSELVDVEELAKLGRREAAEIARHNEAVLAAAAYLFE